ncbi:uncharacterized protein LACBIDRAFT_298646 [Laccaria bicolor S238N-H82]|uniref:Predicted protein n=1 Tax=Laccaria bicolor (strain S238N-H82 / ATCC MYA-4686) TaxID=486041 RepID=B0DDA8_LACBS|nr:uncharacterized protein LACBIDRAFT_298646 [Laccaria bicolor S238N-H82]EDR07580.1 predicted protein [Laccaria bicolor S238N-H82]|eukprot:XP_001881972.1 predicted protein [Laccaria bicolor S238N-H82]
MYPPGDLYPLRGALCTAHTCPLWHLTLLSLETVLLRAPSRYHTAKCVIMHCRGMDFSLFLSSYSSSSPSSSST